MKQPIVLFPQCSNSSQLRINIRNYSRGTLASYVLGDSITQFSLIIGIYLASMGVGAWLTQYVDTQLARRFVEIELAVALIGGLSAPVLFLSFAYLRYFHLLLYLNVFLIGVLVGMELRC